MGYTATFEPQVWQNDYAIPVDPQGPTTWDCTTALTTRPDLDQINATIAKDGYWLDKNDVLLEDPAAPGWVRDWGHQHPFTITVTKETT